MFDFKTIKGALSAYTQTLGEVRAEIDKTEQAIEDCLFAPVAKDEAKKAIRAWVTAEASAYRRGLVEHLAFAATDVQIFDDQNRLKIKMAGLRNQNILAVGIDPMALFNAAGDHNVLQRSLIGLFEEEIWAGIERALDSLKWQPGALTAAERAATHKKLQTKLAELKAKEKALLADAQDVGISVNDGQ